MTTQKYYIDLEKGERECGNCRNILPVDKFSLTSKNSNRYRTDCKACRSKKSFQSQMEKRLIQFPNRYTECDNDDCCFIYSIKKSHCPKCNTPK